MFDAREMELLFKAVKVGALQKGDLDAVVEEIRTDALRAGSPHPLQLLLDRGLVPERHVRNLVKTISEPETDLSPRFEKDIELPGGESLFRAMRASSYETLPVVQSLDESADENLPTARKLGELPGMQVPDERYLFLDKIGTGGMGTVWVVEDQHVRRQVAMKVLLEGANASADQIQRFIEEAQVTGQLEHPNIVPVHEIGVDGEGSVYFTMKLVRGRSLAELLQESRRDLVSSKMRSSAYNRRSSRMSTALATAGGDAEGLGPSPMVIPMDTADPDRPRKGQHGDTTQTRLLNIFLKICDAIAFAHANGVIHRDIKPDNIMIGSFGEVQVMDWGLAKILETRGTSGSYRPAAKTVTSDRQLTGGKKTLDGVVAGTPQYMAPEQARGDIDKLNERSDIYSLGAILYEMLTFQPAFEESDPIKLINKVRGGNFLPPSARRTPVPVPRELEMVVLKAMAHDPRDRYRYVQDLKAEVEAYLDGRALKTVSYTPWQMLRKWMRRNAPLVLLGLMAIVIVIDVMVWSIVELNRERRNASTQTLTAEKALQAARDAQKAADDASAHAEQKEREADAAMQSAAAITESLTAMRAEIDNQRLEAEQARADADAAEQVIEARDREMAAQRADALMWQGRLLAQRKDFHPALDLYYRARQSARRPAIDFLIWDAERQVFRKSITFDTDTGTCVAFALSVDGATAAIAEATGHIRLVDVRTGGTVKTLPGDAPTLAMEFSPDQMRLFSATPTALVAWDLPRAAVAVSRPLADAPAFHTRQMRFDPLRDRLLTVSASGLSQWESSTLAPIDDSAAQANLPAHLVRGLVHGSPNRPPLVVREFPASGNEPASFGVVDLLGRLKINARFTAPLTAAAVFETNAGRIEWFAAGTETGHVFVAGAAAVAEHWVAHMGAVRDVAFVQRPDGWRMITAGDDRVAKVWNPATGQLAMNLHHHSDAVTRVIHTPASNDLMTLGADGRVQVWEMSPRAVTHQLAAGSAALAAVAVGPIDDDKLTVVGGDDAGQLWLGRVGVRGNAIGSTTREPLLPSTVNGDPWPAISHVAIGPLGRWAAMADVSGAVRLISLQGTTRQATLWRVPAESPGVRRPIRGLIATDRWLYVMTETAVFAFAVRADSPMADVSAVLAQQPVLVDVAGEMGAIVCHAARHSRGVVLAVRGTSSPTTHSLILWAADSPRDFQRIEAPEPCFGMASRIDDKVATLTDEAAIYYVSSFALTSEPPRRIELGGHTGPIATAHFSPNGRLFATGSPDHSVRLWDIERRVELLALHEWADPIRDVRFTRDGNHLAVTAGNRITIFDIRALANY